MKHTHLLILAAAALMIGITACLAFRVANMPPPNRVLNTPPPPPKEMPYEETATTTEGVDEIVQPETPVACTLDAKECSDGSFVGRVAPDCEFAQCPTETPVVQDNNVTVCSPESKLVQACTMDYTPVCGLVQVQCITTPCNPVPETFGNACGACAQGNVISYTAGECS